MLASGSRNARPPLQHKSTELMASQASLMDVLEPLSAFDPAVMLYVGLLSTEFREVAEDFWALRQAAYQKGAYPRGQTFTSKGSCNS